MFGRTDTAIDCIGWAAEADRIAGTVAEAAGPDIVIVAATATATAAEQVAWKAAYWDTVGAGAGEDSGIAAAAAAADLVAAVDWARA